MTTPADALDLTAAELLARLRSLGWSLRELEDATGVTRGELSRIARGQRSAVEDKYRRIAGVYRDSAKTQGKRES